MKLPRILMAVAISVVALSMSVFALNSSVARADVLVLVHGWAANADTWVHSGVLPELEAKGWSNAGLVITAPDGVRFIPTNAQTSKNIIYRVQLPAEAPLQLQAAHLYTELEFIQQRHPDEQLTIAGHSAGGVVARLVVVQSDDLQIERLITIASPNLGTSRAIQGLDLAYSKPSFCPGPGMDFLKSIVGGDDYHYLKVSRGALVDLAPAVPGSLIGWLNQQPHPDIKYNAVIRNGDNIVPAFSQDLNQVPSLHGRAQISVTPAGHTLNPADGNLLAAILADD